MVQSNGGMDASSKTLARELNHRVRNMLQIVIGLCNQTLRQSEDLPQFEKLFLGRVQALARVYEVLQREGWTTVGVHELFEGVVSRVLSSRHFRLRGESAYLAADSATGIGLAIHEIAESARQRGIGTSTGNLEVRWSVDRGAANAASDVANRLIVHVSEHGCRGADCAMSAAARERLQRQLRHEINGSITFEDAAEGLRMQLILPLAPSQVAH